MFRLVLKGDSATMMDISVTTKPIVIGRGEGSTHLLKDSSVSLNHAKIIMRQCKVYIRDLDSTNGVYINGEKISIQKGQVISPGDEIKIGIYRFSLEEYNHDKDIDKTMFIPGISEAVRYKLLRKGDSGKDMEFSITTKPITIGRGEGNTILLNEPGVSLHHAKIMMRQSNVYIKDLESTNGVFVNGVKISLTRGQIVYPGDEIKIGTILFALEIYSEDEGAEDTMLIASGPADKNEEDITGENILHMEKETDRRKDSRAKPCAEADESKEVSEHEGGTLMMDMDKSALQVSKLVITSGDDTGKEFLLKDELIIGRSENNDIILKDPMVSRGHHAKVIRHKDDRVIIKDLNSTNGVFVNGKKISTNEDQVISPGDEIKIGTSLFALELYSEDEGAEDTMLIASGPAYKNEGDLTGKNVLHMEKETDRKKDSRAKPCAEADESKKVSEREGGTLMMDMDKSALQVSKLVITSGDDTGKEFLLKDKLIIGRSEDNDIVLKDPMVSREHHAKVVRHKDDWVTLKDLNSANGVFVGGKRIKETILTRGAEIKIGETFFRYVERGEILSLGEKNKEQSQLLQSLNKIPRNVIISIFALIVILVVLLTVFGK